MPISNILYVKICEVSIPFSFIKLKYSLTIFSLSSNIMLKFSSNSNKKNLSNKKAENQNDPCQESKKKSTGKLQGRIVTTIETIFENYFFKKNNLISNKMGTCKQ